MHKSFFRWDWGVAKFPWGQIAIVQHSGLPVDTPDSSGQDIRNDLAMIDIEPFFVDAVRCGSPQRNPIENRLPT
jgi:hypothetical protein